MAIPERINYEERAIDRLLSQFRDKDNFKNLLLAYMRAVQNTQDDLLELLNNRGINDAYGPLLDDLGKIVGAKREGADDEEYRRRILITILANSSEGTPKEALKILKTATDAVTVKLYEHYPANAHFVSDGSYNLDQIYDIMSRVLPVCVSEAVIMVNDGSGEVIPGETGMKLSELAPADFSLVPLTDENGNEIVDDQGNTILVTASVGNFTDDALLAELDPYEIEGEPKQLTEIYDKNR